MFTGLVQATGVVIALESRTQGGALITLKSHLIKSAVPGDSIAVNGCCLTVTNPSGDTASFDLLSETLKLTNLGELKVGSVVNLEPSLRPSDRMGGHFVTGHIDACGTIAFLGQDGSDWRLDIQAPDFILKHIVRKGCVAVDGMSLTVADLIPGGFRIWIIPHTLSATNLKERKTGEHINLESDLLAKYTEKLLQKN